MKLEELSLKKLMVMFTLMVIIGAAIFNLGTTMNYLLGFVALFNPFFVGLAIAYFINVFMVIIEKRLKDRFGKYQRLVSFGLTMLVLVAIMTFVLLNVIPNLVLSIKELVDNIQGLDATVNDFLAANQGLLSSLNIRVPEFNFDVTTLVTTLQNNYDLLWGGFSTYATKAIGGISTFFIGLFFSFYLIISKEKLIYQTRRLLYAFLPERTVDRILAVGNLANSTFTSFITGQCLEALILGLMFTITMGLLGLPYALLVGSLVCVMALIPIVGAFISFVIGFFLILLVDVNQALVFAGVYLVLQQIEGNLIYPNVVGSSVGLPSIWTFASVVLGGSLFGVIGMFVMIPLASVAYTLLKDYVRSRNEKDKIDPIKFGRKPFSKQQNAGEDSDGN